MFSIYDAHSSIDENIILNNEDLNVYDYNNITRISAIINHTSSGVELHDSVDEIYERVTSYSVDVLINNILMNFKKIIAMYIHYRFPRSKNVCFLTLDEVIDDERPIVVEIVDFHVIVIYSQIYIKEMMFKCLSFEYIYEGGDVFVYGDDKKMNGGVFKEALSKELNKKKFQQNFSSCNIRPSKEAGYTYNNQSNSFLLSSVLNNCDYRNSILMVDNLKIQKNLSATYKKYPEIMTIIHYLYRILEMGVFPLTTQYISSTKRIKPTLRINFTNTRNASLNTFGI